MASLAAPVTALRALSAASDTVSPTESAAPDTASTASPMPGIEPSDGMSKRDSVGPPGRAARWIAPCCTAAKWLASTLSPVAAASERASAAPGRPPGVGAPGADAPVDVVPRPSSWLRRESPTRARAGERATERAAVGPPGVPPPPSPPPVPPPAPGRCRCP